MKVLMLSGVALEDGTDAFEGDEVEVSKAFGLSLLHRGKAILVAAEDTASPKKPTKK